MKHKIKYIILCFFIGALLLFGFKIYSKLQSKKQLEAKIQMMPNFNYQTINGDKFSIKNLDNNKKTLFVFFNTDCDFCNEEAKMIATNISQLKHIQLVFISYENLNSIKQFSIHHKLNHHANIHFLSDPKNTFSTDFGVVSFPSIFIYKENKFLKEHIRGQIKFEKLIQKIN